MFKKETSKRRQAESKPNANHRLLSQEGLHINSLQAERKSGEKNATIFSKLRSNSIYYNFLWLSSYILGFENNRIGNMKNNYIICNSNKNKPEEQNPRKKTVCSPFSKNMIKRRNYRIFCLIYKIFYVMVKFLHNIKAWLYKNLLTKDNPHDYIARVSSDRSLGIIDICESAVSRGGSDVSAFAMEHAVNLFLKEMGYQLCNGLSVNTGWFAANVHIRGVFDSPAETFNSEKHTVLIEFHQGSLLRKELETVTVEILGVAETGITIAQVTDVKTGSVNDLITPNHNLKISGYKLKITGDNPANGVYFIDEQGNRIQVDSSDIAINNPSELMIIIPSLAQGMYQLEITTQFVGSGGKVLNEPRSAIFENPLTVS
jgi:hypothetical protein